MSQISKSRCNCHLKSNTCSQPLVLWLHKFVFLLSFSPVKITQTILNTFRFQDQLLRPFKVLNFVTEHLLKYNIIEYIIHPHPFVTITNTFIVECINHSFWSFFWNKISLFITWLNCSAAKTRWAEANCYVKAQLMI